MGRHGSGEPVVTRRPRSLLIAIAALVLVAGGLGWWWWSLRSAADPIDADPVDGYALVVSSADCPQVGVVVDLQPPAPTGQATVSACGQRVGQRLAVEYLRSDPTQVRIAGTGTGTAPGPERWLPIGILAAGVLAVGGTLFLLIERRLHHDDSPTPVSVAELKRRAAQPAAVEVPPAAEPSRPPVADDPTPAAPGEQTLHQEWAAPPPPTVPSSGVPVQDRPRPSDDRDIGDTDQLYLGLRRPQIEVRPPADGDLFTHRGTEAPDRP